MFLTETMDSKILREYQNYDETNLLLDLLDLIQEDHKNTIALIRLEHYCIVNENTALLKEGVGDYIEKAKKFIKDIYDRVVAAIQKFVNWIKDLFDSDKRLIEKVKANDAAKKKSVEVTNIEKAHSIITKLFQLMSKILNALRSQTINEIENVKDEYEELNKQLSQALSDNNKISQTGEGLVGYLKDVKSLLNQASALKKNIDAAYKFAISIIKNTARARGEEVNADNIKIAKEGVKTAAQISALIISTLKEYRSAIIKGLKECLKEGSTSNEKKEEEAKTEDYFNTYSGGILEQFAL